MRSNGSAAAAGPIATEEASMPAAEPQTASLEELRELKDMVKLQRRQEKELLEVQRRGEARRQELLERAVAQRAEFESPGCSGSRRAGSDKDSRKKRKEPLEAKAGLEGVDVRLRDLQGWLEQELLQLGQAQHERVRKLRESHLAEQTTKMLELARARQAVELKNLKGTLQTNTKAMKKKLEAKRLERIQAMVKITSDKMAQERLKREINNSHIQEVVQVLKQMTVNLERHQEQLEEKQAACLEQIRELENQFQKEALAEYTARMESLEAEVKESLRTCFPSETDVRSGRPRRTSPELTEQDLAPAEADVQENRF